MMTQPIRNFKDLSSQTAPAGGNEFDPTLDQAGRLAVHAGIARTELVARSLLWFTRRWRRLVDAIREDFRVRAAESQLYRMTDRELADLGLARTDIPFAVRQVAYGVAPELGGFEGSVSAANHNMRRAA